DREERLLRDPQSLQGQGFPRALRDPDAQAADRHPPAHAEDGRLASAARPSSRRSRHSDSAGLIPMAALLGKKIGMTQGVGEDGRVERVTVIEAGPCHVTAIRTYDRDGYEAVQLAFGEVKEKRLTKAELGHLKKADAPALRHVCEFRDEAGELTVGETVTVEAFEKGQTVKGSGVSKGKGFQGTIKRHNFSRGPVTPGSHNVRAAGSNGAPRPP